MKTNYFVLYPDNTYEFVEKNLQSVENYGTEILNSMESYIGDFSWSIPLEDYPGYFILVNDCISEEKINKLASSFTHKEECDVCVLTKCYEGQACFNNEFETFSEDDKKYFEIILNEQIKVIENENTRSK